MKRIYIIAAAVIALIVAGVLVLEVNDPDVQTEAALPGAQDGRGLPSPSACAGLAGGALVDCRAAYGNQPQMDDRPPKTPEQDKSAQFNGFPASTQAREVADWIVRSGDNGGLPYLVIDKPAASIYVFDAEGRAQAAAPILLGMATGDRFPAGSSEKDMYETSVAERITPAGRFLGEPGRNDKDDHVVWIQYDSGIAMHAVLDTPGQRRRQRLNTATPDDNRISYGCVNVPTEFYRDVVRPLFERTRAFVYVLPDNGRALELFASAYAARAVTAHTGSLQTQ